MTGVTTSLTVSQLSISYCLTWRSLQWDNNRRGWVLQSGKSLYRSPVYTRAETDTPMHARSPRPININFSQTSLTGHLHFCISCVFPSFTLPVQEIYVNLIITIIWHSKTQKTITYSGRSVKPTYCNLLVITNQLRSAPLQQTIISVILE